MSLMQRPEATLRKKTWHASKSLFKVSQEHWPNYQLTFLASRYKSKATLRIRLSDRPLPGRQTVHDQQLFNQSNFASKIGQEPFFKHLLCETPILLSLQAFPLSMLLPHLLAGFVWLCHGGRYRQFAANVPAQPRHVPDLSKISPKSNLIKMNTYVHLYPCAGGTADWNYVQRVKFLPPVPGTTSLVFPKSASPDVDT